jgi:hypothetical protein
MKHQVTWCAPISGYRQYHLAALAGDISEAVVHTRTGIEGNHHEAGDDESDLSEHNHGVIVSSPMMNPSIGPAASAMSQGALHAPRRCA